MCLILWIPAREYFETGGAGEVLGKTSGDRVRATPGAPLVAATRHTPTRRAARRRFMVPPFRTAFASKPREVQTAVRFLSRFSAEDLPLRAAAVGSTRERIRRRGLLLEVERTAQVRGLRVALGQRLETPVRLDELEHRVERPGLVVD